MVRSMPLRPNIKTKISMTFILLGMVVLCCIAALACRYSREELKKAISAQQTILVNGLAAQLDDRLSLIQRQQKRFAASIDAATLTNPHRLQLLLSGEKEQQAFFDDGMMLINPAGRIMAGYPLWPKEIGTFIPKGYEYFQEALAGRKPFISSPHKSSLSGEPVIDFTVPILDKRGRQAAMLAGRHRLRSGSFLSVLANIHIGKSGYLYLVDKHRDVVVTPDKSMAYAQIKPGVDPGLDRALNGFEGTVENVTSGGLAGLSSFKRLRCAPWILGSNYPLSEVYQPIDTAVRNFLLIVLGAGIVSMLVLAQVVQRVTKPLVQLTGHVGAIGAKQGDDRMFRTDSHDEIGTLARVFNAMITELDEQQHQLDEEMAFVESLVMNSAAPIFVLGKDHRIIYWNNALENLTGFAAIDMKGSNRQWEPFYKDKRPTLADVVLDNAEETLPGLYDKFRPSNLVEKAFQGEGWYAFEATGRHYLFFQASPIRSGSGEVIGVVETLEDLTDLKQTEEKLNDQYRFLQEIIDAIPNPVYYKDLQGRHIGCNRAYEAFYGRSKNDILGKSTHELNPTDLAAEHERMDRECLRLAAQQTYESALAHAAGHEHKVIVTKAPFYDKNGNAAGLVGTFIDISERHAMEEEVRRLSQAVEQSPVSIIITDTAGTIEYVNPQFCQLTGFSREEAIGRSPRILKSGETSDELYAELWETIAAGKTWQGEFHNRKKNGELFWEQTSISPLTDKNGRITHYLGFKEDITARKLSEQALADSTRALEAKHSELSELFDKVERGRLEWEDTMDSLSEMVLICDEWGIIRRCNRAVSTFASLSYEQIVGAECTELLNRIGMDMSGFDGNSGHLLFDNGQRHFELLSNTLKHVGSDMIRGVVVTIHETTELFKINEELQKAYDELQQTQLKVFQQEKLASIGQLAAGVAHEINNPMGFISSNLATLGKYQERINEFITILSTALAGGEDNADPAGVTEQRKRLKINYILEDIPQLIAESQDGAQRVRKIVQDLKSFSRVDESEHKQVDINECLDSTINIAWNEIKYVATLDKEYGDIPPVLCYPQQINQVFMNLLVNAAHAIEGQGTIKIRTWQEENTVCVAVSDTGCGISAETLKRIFEPFFTTKPVGKGTGLGLSISYDIIKKHNGDLLVESEQGKGTTFTVKLPIAA